jgi:ABC-type phosphate/phosphonate transport system substrate-binding protein
LDAYWHLLLARHAPQLCAGVRVLSSTALAPMPAFVAAADVPAGAVARLRAAFAGAAAQTWFSDLAEPLLLAGFATVSREAFAPALAWDGEARAAGYMEPA